MGVYHLMGLGLSPGVVTGPLSYLAHRYQRWDAGDREFFARSGERAHREAGTRVGDVQGLVLFTTPEVIRGRDPATKAPVLCSPYLNNAAGRVVGGPEQPRGPMRQVLPRLLRAEWTGVAGRASATLYWCEVNRRDVWATYTRVAEVVAALAGAGGQGKEIWINLTGGNNVMNFAMQLAAAISGAVARVYYVQAADQTAERCIRFTAEEGYWIDLPAMPLALTPVAREILDLLSGGEPATAAELRQRLESGGKFWAQLQGLTHEQFRDEYLAPLWKTGLIAEAEPDHTRAPARYGIGPQWVLIEPYATYWSEVRGAGLTLEQLAARSTWLHSDALQLG